MNKTKVDPSRNNYMILMRIESWLRITIIWGNHWREKTLMVGWCIKIRWDLRRLRRLKVCLGIFRTSLVITSISMPKMISRTTIRTSIRMSIRTSIRTMSSMTLTYTRTEPEPSNPTPKRCGMNTSNANKKKKASSINTSTNPKKSALSIPDTKITPSMNSKTSSPL